MPELPEVETVRRGLAPTLEGARIVKLDQNRADLRFPFPDDFLTRLEGCRVHALSRRSKYLLADTDRGDVLIMHLGMSGSFRVEKGVVSSVPGHFAHARSKETKHDHVVFHLETADGSQARILYNDPRRFGFMTLVERADLSSHPLFVSMGIEPLGNELDGALLSKLLQGKRTTLKAALLNQKLVAGLGNIYVCETLWRSGLDPRRQAGSISGKNGKPTHKTNELARHIRETLTEAIEAGGSSLRDHTQTDGSLGYFQHRFAVYDQEGADCRRQGCKGRIERIVQSNRSTFFCPACQR